jgi:nucleoside-diphosphate-sugar epimerase
MSTIDTTIDEAYKGVRAVVLGGSGFIGAWTARALHVRGAAVTLVGRDSRQAAGVRDAIDPAIPIFIADLGDPLGPDRVIDASRPSVVFNLAGYGVDRSERDVELMETLNARMVGRLCARLAGEPDSRWEGLRLVHVGSALEYGRREGPLSESMAVDPTTDYGRTKLEGTRLVESSGAATGLRAVVARLFTVYGSGEHPDRLLPSLMRTAQTGRPLELTSGRQRRNFTYVGDVAEGLLRLGISGVTPGTVVNLATDRMSSVRTFAETAADVMGIDRRLLVFDALPDRDDEMWHGEVDVNRLRTLTSWVPSTTIADGIRQTWELAVAS